MDDLTINKGSDDYFGEVLDISAEGEFENELVELGFKKFCENINSEITDTDQMQNFSRSEFAILVHGLGDLVRDVISGDYDAVVYLDKSARVLDYAVRHAVTVAKNLPEDFRYPSIRYINIGHEKSGKYDNPVAIESVRESRYGYNSSSGMFNNEGRTFKKKALVVDEYVFSGLTVHLAREVLSGAFPDVDFHYRGVFNDKPFWTWNSEYAGVRDPADLRLNSGGFTTLTPARFYGQIQEQVSDLSLWQRLFSSHKEKNMRTRNIRLLESRDVDIETKYRHNIRVAMGDLGALIAVLDNL